jgi:hypothetical protein
MRKPALARLLTAIGVLMAACMPSRSTVPTVTLPLPPTDPTDTGAPRNARRLALIPGRFTYHLVQNATVEAELQPGAAIADLSMRARLLVDVSSDADSIYNVVISIDSLQMTAGAPIPSRAIPELVSLGPVLQASISSDQTTVESSLPDSLCAYGQLVTAARDLLLPQLPVEISAQRLQIRADSTTATTCRAGTRISLLVIRRLTDLGTEPAEFRVDGKTELTGTGMLGRDSVTVSGSISNQGSALFAGRSRLPSLVRTVSDGLIRTKLGDSTIVFRQKSTQELREQAEEETPP